MSPSERQLAVELERTTTQLAHALGQVKQLEAMVVLYEAKERDIWNRVYPRLLASAAR